ncbi:hypothetical protein ASPCADRAFT_208622 [Aspergillus carbonarius ITEM 5010]|uniref:Uncharacterized protein n=1 Tax=Aspergillus carbonarius (strain ITEM 5010) TaxID=602072 RepID=A0A1R3RKI1_ASPC5|nr:hypothetical protein ASPCADRAFT_208622 [Aspergillus carbonarius ITEM 5010]
MLPYTEPSHNTYLVPSPHSPEYGRRNAPPYIVSSILFYVASRICLSDAPTE